MLLPNLCLNGRPSLVKNLILHVFIWASANVLCPLLVLGHLVGNRPLPMKQAAVFSSTGIPCPHGRFSILLSKRLMPAGQIRTEECLTLTVTLRSHCRCGSAGDGDLRYSTGYKLRCVSVIMQMSSIDLGRTLWSFLQRCWHCTQSVSRILCGATNGVNF